MSFADFPSLPGGATQGGRSSFFQALGIQMRVIGAIMMRELHTRYGRDNIGYLWMIGEPMMLGTVIGVMRLGRASETIGGFNPVVFGIVGYTNYIMFRQIVNRSAGTLEANRPLLYHQMVTILDISVARAVLEAAGCFMSFVILFSLLVAIGFAAPPARPLALLIGIGYMFWMSVATSLIVVGGTYEKHTIERLVHMLTYFSMPLSGAFFPVGVVPEPYRSYLLINPMAHAFELIRYGVFENGTDKYVDLGYTTFWCMSLSILGLFLVKHVRKHVYLS